jgi:hypothetical protein
MTCFQGWSQPIFAIILEEYCVKLHSANTEIDFSSLFSDHRLLQPQYEY